MKATFAFTLLILFTASILFVGCFKSDTEKKREEAIDKMLEDYNSRKNTDQKPPEKTDPVEKKSEDQKKEEGTVAGMKTGLSKYGTIPSRMHIEAPFGIYDNGERCGYNVWFNVWDVKPAGTDMEKDACVIWVDGMEGEEMWACYILKPFEIKFAGLKYSETPGKGYFTIKFNSSEIDAKNTELQPVVIRENKNGVKYVCAKMKTVGMCGTSPCPIFWYCFAVNVDNGKSQLWCPDYFTSKYGMDLIGDVPFWTREEKGYPNYADALKPLKAGEK